MVATKATGLARWMIPEAAVLVACVAGGLCAMCYSGYRALRYSPEVCLTGETRMDELNDHESIASKRKSYSSWSVYRAIGQTKGQPGYLVPHSSDKN